MALLACTQCLMLTYNMTLPWGILAQIQVLQAIGAESPYPLSPAQREPLHVERKYLDFSVNGIASGWALHSLSFHPPKR